MPGETTRAVCLSRLTDTDSSTLVCTGSVAHATNDCYYNAR